MSFNFESLKKNRTQLAEQLNKELDKFNSKAATDDRFWKPTPDKAGNAQAIIRFLPSPNPATAVVRYWDHAFQGPGGWYIEKSLTTFGEPDPATELNSILYNSGKDSDKQLAQKRKRKLRFVSNIYVVKDFGNPANDGKVMLFRFGKKIYDKIEDQRNPEFQDQQKVNVFDLWDGANFRLRMHQEGDFPSYDKSTFETPSPLFKEDTKLKQVYESVFSLDEFVDRSNYKSYTELKTRLNRVLGISQPHTESSLSAANVVEQSEDLPWQTTSVGVVDEEDMSFLNNLRSGKV